LEREATPPKRDHPALPLPLLGSLDRMRQAVEHPVDPPLELVDAV
jgi:hypothetical protein